MKHIRSDKCWEKIIRENSPIADVQSLARKLNIDYGTVRCHLVKRGVNPKVDKKLFFDNLAKQDLSNTNIFKLSEETNVLQCVIKRELMKRGIVFKNKKYVNWDEIVKRDFNYCTYGEISKEFGIPMDVVTRELKKRGVISHQGMHNGMFEQNSKPLVDMYKNGKTVIEISKKFNISKQRIWQILNKNNIFFQDKLTAKWKAIAEKYLPACCYTKVAKDLDISYTTIYKWFNKFGVKHSKVKREKLDWDAVAKQCPPKTNFSALARKLKVSLTSIRRRLIPRGIKASSWGERNKKYNVDWNAIADRKSDSTTSYELLSKQLNVPYGTVAAAMMKRGIKNNRKSKGD